MKEINTEFLTELQKLYTDFKIPNEEYFKYYISLILQNKPTLEKHIIDLQDLFNKEESITKYKFAKMQEILTYIKTTFTDISSLPQELFTTVYTTKEFNDYKVDKIYISIDLSEANWTAFKSICNVTDLPNFNDWTKQTFNLHPALSESKSFRQYIFGNTNPKRLQKVQENMMQKLYEGLDETFKSKLKGKKSDELVFEFDSFEKVPRVVLPIISSEISKLKTTYFTVSEHVNFKEFVRIKSIYDIDGQTVIEKKLMNVPGNRFFMHYKTLILNEELDEKDLFFTNEKHLAKWVI